MLTAIIIIIILAIFVGYIAFTFGPKGGKKKITDAMRMEANGRYHEALTIYDQLLNSGYSPVEIRWRLANTAIKVNLFPRAEKELLVLIQNKEFPENVSIFAVKSLLADCYIKLGKLKEAFIELVELSKIAPDNFQILFELGKLYAGQRMSRNAIQLFEKCYKNTPNNHELTYYIARAYLDSGDPVKATEYLEKTQALKYLDNGRVNYYLGILYYSQKKYNLAMQNFSNVIKLRPNDSRILSETYHLIALCYKEKGLIDEAITHFEKSHSYSEMLPEEEGFGKNTLYNQGVLLFKSGHYKEAIEKFYKLKMIDYKYKDVDQIIKTISTKMKTGEKIEESLPLLHISDNPLINILKRGLLYSNNRFNINVLQSEIDKIVEPVGNEMKSVSYTSVDRLNAMSAKDFKEYARKIVRSSGYVIKSEPRFFQDSDYIDGDAINFIVSSIKDPKVKNEILITVRRYKEDVPEFAVGRFAEWVDEKNVTQGIFIASNLFSTSALKLININPKIRFIDKNGLAKMLGRIG